MTRTEFLEQLSRSLSVEMDSPLVDENIKFYKTYFSTEEAKGRGEQEILEELGDPRILAKSLIEAAQRSEAESDGVDGRRARECGSDEYSDFGNGKLQRLPWWLILILALLLVVALISVIGTLIWSILPFVLPILIVIFIVRLIRRS